MPFEQIPYTNFHGTNQDWMIQQIKQMIADWASYRENLDAAWAAYQENLTGEWADYQENINSWRQALDAAFTELHTYVHDYFDNLDVSEEINNKLDQMYDDGEFDTILLPYFEKYTNEINGVVSTQNSRITTVENEVNNFLENTGTLGTEKDPELIDVRVGANGVTYPTAGNAVRSQFNILNDILDVDTIESVNRINPAEITPGRYIYNGTYENTESYKTTGYIEVNTNDVLHLYYYINQPNSAQRISGERMAFFDVNKNYLSVSGQYPINVDSGYTITDSNIKYVRISVSSSYEKLELLLNSVTDIFTDYHEPYYESVRIEHIEDILDIKYKNIIDAWGDSRTEMSAGTSYPDYLANLLGDSFIVTNHGRSGQSIGQVSFRYGANETFLTLEGNSIPASGSVNITEVICSVGSRQGYNMETSDNSRGSRCSINGVQGTFIYHRSGAKTFTRDSEGAAVSVYPRTKAIPEPYFSPDHMQILWAGKNDFSYSSPYTISGIIDNYAAMVAMIPHDKYLILGETYSNGESYAPGAANRRYVDTVNTSLNNTYPNNFINIQTELVENGLTLENITPTEQDESDLEKGWIPSSLMADTVHPNQYGREAIAKIIHAWMQEHDWI